MIRRVRAWIGLGANLGEPLAMLARTFETLAHLPQTRLLARSSIYASAPIDAPGQPDYFNAVALLETGLEPLALLQALQTIETTQGRERHFHNAPRTLDLDLLLYGEARIDMPDLTLPHPRMHLRAFVLAPIAEIDPDQPIGERGRVSTLLAAVRDQRIQRLEE